MFITDAIIHIEDFGRKIINRRNSKLIWDSKNSFRETEMNIKQNELKKIFKKQRRQQYSQIGLNAKGYRKINQDSFINSAKIHQNLLGNLKEFFKHLTGK